LILVHILAPDLFKIDLNIILSIVYVSVLSSDFLLVAVAGLTADNIQISAAQHSAVGVICKVCLATRPGRRKRQVGNVLPPTSELGISKPAHLLPNFDSPRSRIGPMKLKYNVLKMS
jgi:hypothetical protein